MNRIARIRTRWPVMAASLVLIGVTFGASVVTGERTAAASGAVPASLSQPNVVADGGFERAGLGPWNVSGGQNWAVYTSPSAPVGDRYLETNSGSSSQPSVYQDVSMAPVTGHSYRASLYLKAPSSPVSVALVVWAIGGSTEVGQSNFVVSSSSWTRYDTVLDVAGPGHSSLRFQLYFGAGPGLDVGGAELQDTGVGDAGFKQGLGPWRVSPGQNYATYHSTAPPLGGSYLETNSGATSSPSLYQDVAAIPVVGHNYQASVWLKAVKASAPVSVALVVWGTGGTTESGQTQVDVTSTGWTEFFANLDVADPGHTGLRFQLFWSGSAGLDVGDAMLQDSGVSDANFDQTGLGPWAVLPGSNWAVGTGSGAVAGRTWLQTNTGTLSASTLYQDVPTNLVAGRLYTGSVFFKSFGGPMTVSLVLWAMGGPPTELGKTMVTVGSSWQQVSAELAVVSAGHSDLRLQVYFSNPGRTLGVALASLPGVDTDPPLGPAAPRTGVGLYGPSSTSTISSEIAQGWPIVGETGGLGTTRSPYTAPVGTTAPDLAAAQAISVAGRPVTWLSFWTVSAPVSGDSWAGDGAAAGRFVASFIDSVSSRVKPAFVILDPEGYPNGQGGGNPYPSTFGDWSSWMYGWIAGIKSVDGSLTPALYVNQSEYSDYGLGSLQLPIFVAIAPILGNFPGNGLNYRPSANVDGYIAIGGSCPPTAYVDTIASWGGSYNTMQFPDSGDDCPP